MFRSSNAVQVAVGCCIVSVRNNFGSLAKLLIIAMMTIIIIAIPVVIIIIIIIKVTISMIIIIRRSEMLGLKVDGMKELNEYIQR